MSSDGEKASEIANERQDFFTKPRDALPIPEREYERPKSNIEAEELNIPGMTLREKDVLEPAKRQFRRTLANFVDTADKEEHTFSLNGWAQAMLEANQVIRSQMKQKLICNLEAFSNGEKRAARNSRRIPREAGNSILQLLERS